MLTACFIVLAPYAAFVGNNNLRVGHLIILILLTYLVSTRFIFEGVHTIFRMLEKKYEMPGYICSSAIIIVLCFLASIQFFYTYEYAKDKGNLKFISKSYLYSTFFQDNTEFKVADLYNESDKEAGDWIKSQLPAGSCIMVSRSGDRPIYFYAEAIYPIIGFPEPYLSTGKGMNRMNDQDFRDRNKPNNNVICLTSWSYLADPRNWISALTEQDLFAIIKEKSVKYAVIHRWTNYLTLYFDYNKAFKKIKEFDSGKIKIYEVGDISNSAGFKPMIVRRLILYFKELERTSPETINWYVEKFFKPLLGWNKKTVDKIVNLPTEPSIEGDDFNVVASGKTY